MNGALQDVVAVNLCWGFYFNVELWQNCKHTVKERLDSCVLKGQRSKVRAEGTHHSEPR